MRGRQVFTKGYDPYCLEDATIQREERRRELAAICSGRENALYDDGKYDYNHADQRKSTGFCELMGFPRN